MGLDFHSSHHRPPVCHMFPALHVEQDVSPFSELNSTRTRISNSYPRNLTAGNSQSVLLAVVKNAFGS